MGLYSGFGKDFGEELLGKTLTRVEGAEVESDLITFATTEGRLYRQHHPQD